MTLKKHILFIAITFMLFSCNKTHNQITDINDYQSFLEVNNNKSLVFAEAEKDFWKTKYKQSPNQASYLSSLASSYSMIFEFAGTIEALKKAEESLLEANQKVAYKRSGLLFDLAKNYISQHRFKEALNLLKKAEQLGEKKQTTKKMLFDVYLELGDDINAKKNLTAIKDFNDFDFLIRLSKWLDHKGDLNSAIKYLEKAKSKAEVMKNENLMLWSYSNLADFYGHAGKIEHSYEYYLKALNINANYIYALRGVAWIVFSHEKDSDEATRIIDIITQRYNSPDLKLFKAELAEFKNDHKSQKRYLNQYFDMVSNKDYGDMYNIYNTLLYADDNQNIHTALSLANKEIENRPTVQSYDLLAWVYYKKGDSKKALQIIEEHVVGKTFEATIQYHIAEIYKVNGMEKSVMKIKSELLGSIYELGPLMEAKIQML